MPDHRQPGKFVTRNAEEHERVFVDADTLDLVHDDGRRDQDDDEEQGEQPRPPAAAGPLGAAGPAVALGGVSGVLLGAQPGVALAYFCQSGFIRSGCVSRRRSSGSCGC